MWSYQEDLRPEEIAEIERGDAEKSAQVEEAEVRDRVARNTARRSQSLSQASDATL
jgi:hypothetical protein